MVTSAARNNLYPFTSWGRVYSSRENHRVRFWILLLAFTLVGCDNARQETGAFTAVFSSIEDADNTHERGSVILHLSNGTVTLQPRRVPTLFENQKKQVEFIVTVDLKRDWGIRDDEDFRTLVTPELTPRPLDIIAISLSGVRYINRRVERSEDIKSFFECVSDRGTCGWSKNEIELLLPNGYALPTIPADAKRHTVWIDWPIDERQLSLDFEYDEDKQEQILMGYGLGYPR
jgi:hypothetical protein